MTTKIFVNLLVILFLGIIQVSFLTTWPTPVRFLNLILSLVIFLVVIVNYQRGLVLAFGGGLFLDLFSVGTFGFTTLAMIITAVSINFLFNNFFTNRSFYSLTILGSLGTVIYNAFMVLSSWLIHFLGLGLMANLDAVYFYNFIWQLFLNILILFIIFFIFHFSTGRLKANFLLPH